MKRSDIHAPSRIQPEDYTYVGSITHDDSLYGDVLLEQRRLIDLHMQETHGTYSRHEHGGNCHICGAWMKDFAVFYHAKTNTYIRTGFDCAEKLDFSDVNLFKSIRTERQAMQAAKAGKLKAAGILREMGILEEIEPLFNGGNLGGTVQYPDTSHLDKWLADKVDNQVLTIVDIVRRLIKNGFISDPQANYLHVLLNQIKSADKLQDKVNEEHAKLPDAPEGRVVVTGRVLSMKSQDTDFGTVTKMLVQDITGYKVWSTVPSSIYDVVVGAMVRFTVSLKPSNNDRVFAFGSRPSKAELLVPSI